MADEENKTRVILVTAGGNFVTLIEESELEYLDDYIQNQNVWFDCRPDDGNPTRSYSHRVLSLGVFAYRILS